MVGIALAVLVLGSATWTVRRGDDSARLQGALSGLAPYPGSVLVYITSDDLHVVRNYAVQAPDDQITRYYEQVLEANGWILRQVPQTFPNVGVCAEKDGVRVMVTYSGLPPGSYAYSLDAELNLRCVT